MTDLLLGQTVGVITEKQRLQLAYLCIVTQEFNIASELLSQC